MRLNLLPLLCIATLAPIAASAEDLTPASAAAAFTEARAVSDQDGGRLWGKPLYGPMMLVDPRTHFAVANQADPQGLLKPVDGVFAGTLPTDFVSANTAVEWHGVRWTMIDWPLPEASARRHKLMAHELFHRIEPDLGIAVISPPNAHLDTRDGRYWLFLELRALQVALVERGPAQADAIRDALTFRARRLALFAAARTEEAALEANEGLAEYTGAMAANDDADSARWQAINGICGVSDTAGVSKSFAYATGPAWGMLLDRHVPGWRAKVASAGFVEQLAAVLPPQAESAAAARAVVYGGKALGVRESERAARAEAFAADVRTRLLNAPVLAIATTDAVNYGYDPYDVTAIGDGWFYYNNLTVSDTWGKLTVKGGVLFSPRRQQLRIVPPPTGGPGHLETKDWALDLAPGWRVAPAPGGGFEVAKT